MPEEEKSRPATTSYVLEHTIDAAEKALDIASQELAQARAALRNAKLLASSGGQRVRTARQVLDLATGRAKP